MTRHGLAWPRLAAPALQATHRCAPSTAATAMTLAAPADLLAQAATARAPASAWDAGAVRHLLPTVSHDRLLIKISFNAPLTDAAVLRVGLSNAKIKTLKAIAKAIDTGSPTASMKSSSRRRTASTRCAARWPSCNSI